MERPKLISTALTLLLSSAALGAPDDVESEVGRLKPEPGTPEISFTPGVYLPRLVGDAGLAPGTEVSLDEDLDLDDLEVSPNFELRVRSRDQWHAHFGWLDFDTDTSGTYQGTATFGDITLAPGDPYEASFDLTTFSAEIGIPLFRPYRDSPDVDLRFSPLLSFRYVDVEQKVTEPGVGAAYGDGTWYGVLFGAEMEVQFFGGSLAWLRPLRLEASISAGPTFGGDGGSMWQVRANLSYDILDNVAFQFGYRLVEVNADDGDYSFNGGLQGLFLAATLRF